ncbi:MAG: hypothetical protein HKN43_03415, partial [Rhodothermales bacterium]|nr:hypothetical protein [Rhodothermales bacterium]
MSNKLFLTFGVILALSVVGCETALTEEPAATVPQIEALDDFGAFGKGHRSTSTVYRVSDLSPVGHSSLVRGPNSVSMTLRTSDIPKGSAVTIWWAIFNNPENCAAARCINTDIFNPAVRADVTYATGRVVGHNSIRFGAQRYTGDFSGSIIPLVNHFT